MSEGRVLSANLADDLVELVLENVQIEGVRVAGSLILLLEDLLVELGDLREDLDKHLHELTHIDVASLITLC